jgi:hypothetical protein
MLAFIVKISERFMIDDFIVVIIIMIVEAPIGICAGYSLTYIISVYLDDKNQRQYFSKEGILIVLITRDSSYPLYRKVGWQIRQTIYFTKIEKIKKGPCSIIITGDIIVLKSPLSAIYEYDLKKTKVKQKYKIPRNFSHEEQISDMNIAEYNRTMAKLNIDITDFYVNRKRIPDKYLKAENRR